MTEARWMLYAKKADFNKIAEKYHISPVTARIIRNRGLEDVEDIGRYLNRRRLKAGVYGLWETTI